MVVAAVGVVVVLLVALAGLLLFVDIFEPPVVVGLLLCAEQSPARPRDNAAMTNVFVFMVLIVGLMLRITLIPNYWGTLIGWLERRENNLVRRFAGGRRGCPMGSEPLPRQVAAVSAGRI